MHKDRSLLRYSDHLPLTIRNGYFSRPMKSRIDFAAPARRGWLIRRFQQTGVDRPRARTGLRRKDVIVSRDLNSAQGRGDHSVGLKYALHEADKIAAALLDRVVRQAAFIN